MREIKAKPSSIILEPVGKNTAPAIAVSIQHIIEEQNENNNDFEILLPIGKALEETVVEDTSSSISSNMIYFGSAGILLIILVLFGLFAPAKIKKIE